MRRILARRPETIQDERMRLTAPNNGIDRSSQISLLYRRSPARMLVKKLVEKLSRKLAGKPRDDVG